MYQQPKWPDPNFLWITFSTSESYEFIDDIIYTFSGFDGSFLKLFFFNLPYTTVLLRVSLRVINKSTPLQFN